ncbi:MAG: molybdenum cofactor biosynthesis protein MoaE [Promethearchaeota archaeon]
MNETNELRSGIYNKGEITLEEIIKTVKNNPKIKKVGSIHVFSGIVRESSKEGKQVKSMKIDSFDDLANKTIEDICERLKKKNGIIDVKIIHFKGDFSLSDDLVYVVVASSHREEGFGAIKNAVDSYKKEIAVWKREDFIDGTSKWIH